MKRISILASGTALTLLALVVAQGCSSAEEGDDQNMLPLQGNGGSSAGAPVAAAGAPAATAGTGSGGRSETAGAGGTPFVGMAGTPGSAAGGAPAAGAGGAPAAAGAGGAATGEPTLCVGSVSNNTACTVTCIDPCGVFQLGTRLCTCTNLIAACESCGFEVNDVLITPPTEAFAACVGNDGMPATDTVMEGLDQIAGYTCPEDTRCEPSAEPDRYCACRGNEWDCDAKPDSFTF